MFPRPDSRQPDDASNATRDLLRLGVVQSVDLAAGRCVVAFDDQLVTGPLPWAAARAGGTRIWTPPTAGEQVLVFAPEGDLERAIVSGSLFCDAAPAPAADGRTHVQFSDGAVLSYDPAAGDLAVTVINAVAITAPGGASIEADTTITGKVTITGDVDVTGKIDATEDVKAGAISLKTHKHLGVATGPGVSGIPQVPA